MAVIILGLKFSLPLQMYSFKFRLLHLRLSSWQLPTITPFLIASMWLSIGQQLFEIDKFVFNGWLETRQKKKQESWKTFPYSTIRDATHKSKYSNIVHLHQFDQHQFDQFDQFDLHQFDQQSNKEKQVSTEIGRHRSCRH